MYNFKVSWHIIEIYNEMSKNIYSSWYTRSVFDDLSYVYAR